MDKQSRITSKQQAEEFMRHPFLKDFFERADQELFKRWKACAGDPEKAELVRFQSLGLDAFKEFMHKVIVDGRMAEKELEEIEKRRTNQ